MNEIKKHYLNRLTTVVRAQTHRGFVDWRGVRIIAKEAAAILREGEERFEQKDYSAAFYIASSVLDVLVEKLAYIDDSSGFLGGAIRAAEKMISDIIVLGLSEEERLELFNYFTSTYDKKRFKGWDWHLMMLQFAVEVACTPKEFEALQQRINAIPKKDRLGMHFEYYYGQELTAKIIHITHSEKDYLQYLEENISNPAFRKRLIELAIEAQNYDRAMKLADDARDEANNNSRYVSDWEVYKLLIYEKQKDVSRIIEYARKFLTMPYNVDHRMCYELLKKSVPASDWSEFIAEVVAVILRNRDTNYLSRAFQIWKWEERVDQMLDIIAVSNSLYFIEEHENEFLPTYAAELVDCYTAAIFSFVAESRERKRYKAACRYIRKIKKLGYARKADEMIGELRQTYSMRSALLDELDQLEKKG